MAYSWTRSDYTRNTVETLTLVKFTFGSSEGCLAIQITAGVGNNPGDDFIGLFSTDGVSLQLSNSSWEIVEEGEGDEDVTDELLESIEADFSSTYTIVERT